MKKHIIFLTSIFIILLIFNNFAAAEKGDILGQDIEFLLGQNLPHFGWAQHNEAGLLTGFKGINLGIGYSQKNYFSPGIKEGQFNNFWGWGTFAFFLPYAEIGTDYPFAVQENGNYWTVGGAAELILYPTEPNVRISLSYNF